MAERRGNVDWERTKVVLRGIHDLAPDFLATNALIGGAASWFYREALIKMADVDFPLPSLTPDEATLWFSKEVDFLGDHAADYPKLLGVAPVGDPPRVMVADTWIDSPNRGMTISPESCVLHAQDATIDETISFAVMDPVSLYEEKCALVRDRAISNRVSRPQDPLHVHVLREYLYCNLVRRLEAATITTPEARAWGNDARRLKTMQQDFHLDLRYRRRVHAALPHVRTQPARAVTAYVEHHVPPP